MYHVEDDLRYARNCLKKESFFVNFFCFSFSFKAVQMYGISCIVKTASFPISRLNTSWLTARNKPWQSSQKSRAMQEYITGCVDYSDWQRLDQVAQI